MPEIRRDQPLLPSVLDRLLDDDPAAAREPVKSRTQLLAELKESVRRDLENLLNARWRAGGWPPELSELDQSLVAYGLPDLVGGDLGRPSGRDLLRETLAEAIRRFEPRLQRVRVELLDNVEPADRTLRFRISGVLAAEPAPAPVAFDSQFEPGAGTVHVKGPLR